VGCHVDWVVNMWAESHMGWARFLRDRNGPTNIIYQFSFKTDVVFFAGVFVSLTKSKNYEIWRVDRELQEERSGF
jgi:hypothetical protein